MHDWYIQQRCICLRVTFCAIWVVQTSLFWTYLVHPSKLHWLRVTTPPLTSILVHPSMLHRFTFAPCEIHTPLLTTICVHPTKLHGSIVTSLNAASLFYCSMSRVVQTPPLTTIFVHPSMLHRFKFAPCVIQTPPL